MANRTRRHSKQKPHFQTARIAARRERNEAVGMISKTEETQIIRALIKQSGQRCFYCRTPLTFTSGKATLDHMTPLAQGGTNQISNFALACFKCNAEKHNKTVDEYRQWLINRNYKPKF
jgi:5-methylcytosine-specific restriction endonuclease McrA